MGMRELGSTVRVGETGSVCSSSSVSLSGGVKTISGMEGLVGFLFNTTMTLSGEVLAVSGLPAAITEVGVLAVLVGVFDE